MMEMKKRIEEADRERQPTPLERAQELAYDAWEAPSLAKAVLLARKALDISPDCADAYVILGMAADFVDEAIGFFRSGVEAGERALGPNAFKKYKGSFWGVLDTRPYMRSRFALGEALWEGGQAEEAVGHFQALLKLNPNDNQGARDLLAPILVYLDRDRDADRLLRKYRGDYCAAGLYTSALLAFRKTRESEAAHSALLRAAGQNGHVPDLLLHPRRMPRLLPDCYVLGSREEAVSYVHQAGRPWRRTPGALEWLANRPA